MSVLAGLFLVAHGLVHLAVLIGAILAHLDFLDAQIEALSEAIEMKLAPFGAAVELLRTIPGVETRTAQNIVAEIGTDMSVFPSAAHLASWADRAPATTSPPACRSPGTAARPAS